MNSLNLTRDDQIQLQALLESMSKKAQYKISLGTLVQRWNTFVREVERGYDDSIYEYTNDLGTRLLLAQVEAALSKDGRDALYVLLEPWDERFRSATVKTEYPLVGRTASDVEPYWFNRIPIHPGPQLAEDLNAEGV